MDNCVGANNHKYFLGYLASLLGMLVWCQLGCFVYWSQTTGRPNGMTTRIVCVGMIFTFIRFSSWQICKCSYILRGELLARSLFVNFLLFLAVVLNIFVSTEPRICSPVSSFPKTWDFCKFLVSCHGSCPCPRLFRSNAPKRSHLSGSNTQSVSYYICTSCTVESVKKLLNLRAKYNLFGVVPLLLQ